MVQRQYRTEKYRVDKTKLVSRFLLFYLTITLQDENYPTEVHLNYLKHITKPAHFASRMMLSTIQIYLSSILWCSNGYSRCIQSCDDFTNWISLGEYLTKKTKKNIKNNVKIFLMQSQNEPWNNLMPHSILLPIDIRAKRYSTFCYILLKLLNFWRGILLTYNLVLSLSPKSIVLAIFRLVNILYHYIYYIIYKYTLCEHDSG